MVTEYLKINAEKYSDFVAIKEVEYFQNEYRERSISWRIFNEQANKVVHFLKRLGVKKGDKIGIFLQNCLEWLPVFFGVLKSGAIAVPLNYRYNIEELQNCLNVTECSVLFSAVQYDEMINICTANMKKVPYCVFLGEKINAQDGEAFCYFSEILNNSDDGEPICVVKADDDAAIYFTSGTTGVPRAILITHNSLSEACKLEQKHHNQMFEDVFLCIPPLYHTGAIMHWFGSLMVGGKVILLKNVSPRYIIETASREKITIAWLLVPWVQDILASIECGDIVLEEYDLSHWRLMHMGAQPIPASLIEKWLKLFPDHLYDTNYGLSEATGPGCIHLGVENIHKLGAIGKAGDGWKAAIFKEDGIRACNGETGELAVQGPGVMKEYYKDPEATKEILRNGWLYTGDMAYEDEDGFIYIVDRKKDIIISGGENISAVQIESYIVQHPAVKDVAVIGINSDRIGEIILAVIELKPNCKCSKHDMMKFFANLPDYKRPRKIVFDHVPRNSTGKIDKVNLKKQYSALTGTELYKYQ